MGRRVKKSPKCCTEFSIKPMDMLDQSRLPETGLEFLRATGADQLTETQRVKMLRRGVEQPDGQVLVQHRCKQLTPSGLCRIYDTRPVLCRAFECSAACKETHGA